MSDNVATTSTMPGIRGACHDRPTAPDPERVNRVAVLKGIGGGHFLLINGRVDTVAAFKPESWSTEIRKPGTVACKASDRQT